MHPSVKAVTVGISSSLLIGTFATSTSPSVPDPAIHPAPNLQFLQAPSSKAADGMAPFSLSFNGILTSYSIFSTFVLPGEELSLLAYVPGAKPLAVQAGGGALVSSEGEPNAWRWRAPAVPGLYPLDFSDGEGGSLRLNAFVLKPYDGSDQLNGYRIGRYQSQPLRDDPAYLPPRGFVELTPELVDVKLSPNFTLGQFPCKQQSTFPKYLVLQETLLSKLEGLLAEARGRGLDVRTFTVMSGYRTPYYNARIGNETTYSRHTYGDAADIFVDENRDGRMDDLNGNGRVDVRDAEVLLSIAEELEREADPGLVGGLGLYGPRRHRGPFVHVDARGYQARWAKR
ncbi:MAG TPA: D-Ala-D-Ala carboxypeptidase family metallohydrolase [Thermoanaerobaculia bacterium]|nr:D-Ala-D-Ala carboxypeptidase family metallohydrolase [Thermoanaerobaculia bacterium]